MPDINSAAKWRRAGMYVNKVAVALPLWAAICLFAPARSAPATDSASELIGLWGCERVFGPELRGELRIEQSQSGRRARIAGAEAVAHFIKGSLSLVFPGDRGEFRGHLSKDGNKISGHWIQPQTVVSGVRYATPVELNSKDGKTWRGEVAPLEDRISIYLSIQRQQDGSIGAFIRNPELNLGVSLRFVRVEREGDAIKLVMRAGGELPARYDPRNTTLSFAIPSLPGTFAFTLRDRDRAPGFYPRTPAVDTYVYHQPAQEADGWQTASLADARLDPELISDLVQSILSTKTESVATAYIQGLLIARHGKLALEEYFYGFDRDGAHDTRSAGKSLATTLVGIAIDREAHLQVATPVYSLFPEYSSYANDEPRKRKITVEHLLTMSAGYDCDDNSDSSPGNENTMQSQTGQPDWYKYMLDLPMATTPGEKAIYCSGGMNLLGGAVSNATGSWLPDFLYESLAAPLDIHSYHVNLTPLGNAYMGGGIYMRPRDFMKLGQLFLAGGRWNGRQIVSKQWVDQATRPHSSINAPNDYGYGWWMNDYRVGEKTYRAFYASGNGGQLVIAIPDLDLVVMFAGGNYGNYPTWAKFRDELVPRFIIPAAAPR